MTQTLARPVPVIGWDVTDDEWLYARRSGLGGSDILAVLGFNPRRSPWDVWADKTGLRSWDDAGSEAAALGHELEPWLEVQASKLLGLPVARPAFRTYSHPEHPWRMCSPDGLVVDGRLAEYKTGGLASGFGPPAGWEDGGTPLGYEFQVRWSLHVMDCEVAEVFGLIAGLGRIRRTIVRDLTIEYDMVQQVTEWYERYITGGEEPPMGASDNASVIRMYAKSNGSDVDLTGRSDVMDLVHAYCDARRRESISGADKKAIGAEIKKLLGANARGLIAGAPVLTWSEKKGAVDWPALVADLVARYGIEAPDPEAYRKDSTRSLNVKDV